MAGNQASAGHLLSLVREGRASTRGELQRATGLSRSTVGQRLDQLFRAGWIREAVQARPGGPAAAGAAGRPSVRLEFDTSHGVVLAADLGTRHARAAVLDLAGRELARHVGPLVVADGPETVLRTLAQWFGPLLKEAGVSAGKVCGIGLSVPGPVDWESARVIQPPIMPGWDGYPIRDGMRRMYTEHVGSPHGGAPVPVLVDNDANLMAYAEQRAAYPGCSAFLLIKASTGIGAGVVVDGRIYRGIDGGAGDIGHIRLHDTSDALCACGSYGCLAAVASGRALARELTAAGVRAASGTDVRDLLAAGDPEAVRLAQEAGRRVGEVLGTVVTLLNPGVLMIGGDLAGTPFTGGVREVLYQRAMPRTVAGLQVVTAQLGESAGLFGAGAMVVESLYAAEAADARLARLADGAGADPEGVSLPEERPHRGMRAYHGA